MEKRVLIARWLGPETNALPIYDEASVSSARRRVREVGKSLSAGKDLVESVALIASELTHNQLAHARQGYFAIRPIKQGDVKGLEVVAADLGPGLQEPLFPAARGIRTEGSLRAGLEGVFRIADDVALDSRIAEGTCVTARKFETSSSPLCEVAIMGRPYPGEVISGDDAVFLLSNSGFVAAVADGLGHGPEAREASNRAMEAVGENRDQDINEILRSVNRELAGTRGCAMTIVRFTAVDRALESVSAGDTHAHLYGPGEPHFFTATPAVLGDARFVRRRIRTERIAVEPRSVLVMFTDGLSSRTTLKGQVHLLRQPAIVIAQHLIETASRDNDDALVLVAKFKR